MQTFIFTLMPATYEDGTFGHKLNREHLLKCFQKCMLYCLQLNFELVHQACFVIGLVYEAHELPSQ